MKHFRPATYICARCTVEHCGAANALPAGWEIRYTFPGDRRGHAVCADCATQCPQRDFGALVANPFERPTTGMLFGIAAAGFAGRLLPVGTPRPEQQL